MDGFVVTLTTEDEEAKQTFWNGSVESGNLEDSRVYQTRSEAKRISGEIQSRYIEHSVGVMPVKVTITAAQPAAS